MRNPEPNADQPIRVIIAEDEDLYRDMLRTALSADPQLDVVGTFPNGEAAANQAPPPRRARWRQEPFNGSPYFRKRAGADIRTLQPPLQGAAAGLMVLDPQ